MTSDPPRLRMFAGPTGSGKTTVKKGLGRPASWFGIYINPDEMELEIRQTGGLAINALELSVSTTSLQRHFSSSQLLHERRPDFRFQDVCVTDDSIFFADVAVDS